MNFSSQIKENDWIVGLFSIMLWFLAVGRALPRANILVETEAHAFKKQGQETPKQENSAKGHFLNWVKLKHYDL